MLIELHGKNGIFNYFYYHDDPVLKKIREHIIRNKWDNDIHNFWDNIILKER